MKFNFKGNPDQNNIILKITKHLNERTAQPQAQPQSRKLSYNTIPILKFPWSQDL